MGGSTMMIVAGAAQAAQDLFIGAANAQTSRNYAKIADYNAQIADWNAQMAGQTAEMNMRRAELDAALAEHEGKIAGGQAAEEAYKAKARQRAALAQGGIIESTTGKALMAESERAADSEQQNILWRTSLDVANRSMAGYGAAKASSLEAYNFQLQGWDQRNQAKQHRANATNYLIGGVLAGGSSVLGGISKSYTVPTRTP